MVRRFVLLLSIAIFLCGTAAFLVARSFTFVSDSATPQSVVCKTGDVLKSDFESVEDGFAAAFPCTPVRTTSTASTPFGNITIVRYESEVDGVNYAVSFVDYANLVPGGELPALVINFIIDGAKRGVLRSAHMDNPTYTDIKLGNYIGQSILASNAEQTLRGNVYIVGKSTYQIVLTLPNDYHDPSTADKFLNSFRVVDRQKPPSN
ncbi:MAG: hypothetical protein KF716_00955 [Anaerolineae bacterium]|nr:hypothetical protein [Anaerolineae bacterium]